MIEDMHMRKLAPKTQASYICAVKKLSDYLAIHRIQPLQKTYASSSCAGRIKVLPVRYISDAWYRSDYDYY